MCQLRTAILKIAPPLFDDIDFAFDDFCGTEAQQRFLLKETEGVGFTTFGSGMLGGFETTGAPPPMALIGRYNVLLLANACCSHSEAKRRVPYDSGQCVRRESNSEECRETA